jgi:GT2 family glycosyltransferase
MLFSVVIPTFNRLDLLPRTLAALSAQTFSDYETIIVDDGSTDGSREYLASLGNTVTVLHQENRGPGEARNLGVRAANGDYVAFLDSDDIWFPWTLATFGRIIAEAGPELLTASYFEFSDEAVLRGVRETPLSYRRFDDFISSSEQPISAGSNTMVIKRSRLVATGGFTSLLINGEDHDLVLRLGTAPGFAQVLSPVTLAWRRHEGSVTNLLDRSIAGMSYLIAQERSQQYPGGERRAPRRREIVTRHVRAIVFACLKAGEFSGAMTLYRLTAAWHVRQGRWRFLAAVPAVAAVAALKHRARRASGRAV